MASTILVVLKVSSWVALKIARVLHKKFKKNSLTLQNNTSSSMAQMFALVVNFTGERAQMIAILSIEPIETGCIRVEIFVGQLDPAGTLLRYTQQS